MVARSNMAVVAVVVADIAGASGACVLGVSVGVGDGQARGAVVGDAGSAGEGQVGAANVLGARAVSSLAREFAGRPDRAWRALGRRVLDGEAASARLGCSQQLRETSIHKNKVGVVCTAVYRRA